MQGIDFGPDGTLYASEQGPKTDDEVNILEAGRQLRLAACRRLPGRQGLPVCPLGRRHDALRAADSSATSPSIPRCRSRTRPRGTSRSVTPLATLFTVPERLGLHRSGLRRHRLHLLADGRRLEHADLYARSRRGIPGWENSLLVTTLKRGSLYRVPLAEDGKTVCAARSSATSSPRTASATWRSART